ncbi:MAG: ABC transporter ATP-binding protein [Bacteroidales bacterium]|nr:ABC transporter ATP-binding protein [Anaerotignum sp.]MCI5679726.1 ABC transporter ATP-binding protein [Bacteroidales bacterium]MDY3927640.1 ABC transporter ATP-binding protein [Anaerotignum sp.]
MVEVRDLKFSYLVGMDILKEVSFQVETGEIVGVLGANGVGKSTLLKLLAGILTPRSGSISIEGKPVQESYGKVAYISEAGSYFKDLTPKEFGAFLLDFFPDFDVSYYEKLVAYFQLEDKPIKNMSKGQKAKAEVAAGMAKRAKYMIMDEPFIGKDMFTRQDFMQALAGSLTGEETIFITTHEIDEIENFIDRALIIHDKVIVADVTMDELRQQGKSLTNFMKEITGYQDGNFAGLIE